MLKLVVISDSHCGHAKLDIPECDVLIHCGDFTWRGKRDEVEDFIVWFKQQPAKHRVCIAGNHEMTFDPNVPNYNQEVKALMLDPDITYLENGSVVIEGIKFYGTPWTPWFYDWAFNGIIDADLPFTRGVSLTSVYDEIPHDVSVLICHGPPYDILDKNIHGERCGSAEMRKVIDKMDSLKLFMFGHIHEGRGVKVEDGVTYVNASSLDRDYKNIRRPVIIHLDDDGKVSSVEGVRLKR